MSSNWDTQLASMLNELSDLQRHSLDVLERKRRALATADMEGLARTTEEEGRIVERLQSFVARREALLEQAQREGLPCRGIRELATAVGGTGTAQRRQLLEAAGRARLLQIQALTNWMLTQKAVIHLSQLLEIIATGGRPKPTYDKGESCQRLESCGALVDREV
ncbi:MAG: flagellar protein FlgN [Thermogutta sp.]|nr:flagellar protein FlgN [Thermogutta sp.]